MNKDKSENKNIVLCSDGTGQAGGQGFVSNVWRVFKAVDRHNAKEQVAFHVDGVGTETNKYLRAFGGAFGWGLSKDIRQLYAALVRSYEPGDDIFLFGFSRGAFTVRSLAGMIHDIGILKGDAFRSDEEINDAVKAAYTSYRSNNNKTMNHPIHECRDIKFVGVWDTVDAIGVPVDELRDLIYKLAACWKRPHLAELNPSIQNAFHAISIDDERKTFHPMIWDEGKFVWKFDDEGQPTNMLEQVWFAGVHTNVGGGYPKDSLAFIPLDWMMKHAEQYGLKFDPAKWTRPAYPAVYSGNRQADYSGDGGEFQVQADKNGRIYDSRGGAAVYYRYKPRMIGDLWPKAQKTIECSLPKIHESALLRIQSGYTGYAPTAIPEKFEYVSTWKSDIQSVGSGKGNIGEGPDMENARGWICWRRVLYYLFIAWTFSFIAAGIILDKIDGNPCGGDWLCSGLAWIIESAKNVLPDFAYDWLDSYASHPYVFLIAILVLFCMNKCKGWLRGKTDSAANEAWKKIAIKL